MSLPKEAIFEKPHTRTGVAPGFFQSPVIMAGTSSTKTTPDYIYDEDKFLAALKAHVDSTYSGHYAKGKKIQSAEYIMSKATTLDYLLGNVYKYVDRFGQKEGFNQIDLMKAVHYIMMMAKYSHEIQAKSTKGTNT